MLAFVGATIRGALRATGVDFVWRPGEGSPFVQNLDFSDRQWIEDADRKLRNAPHTPSRIVADRLYRPGDPRPLTQQYAVLLRQTIVEKDVDFRQSHGLFGADLEEARIAGRLRFCRRHSGRHVDSARWVSLTERATHVGGVLNLRGTRIESDCSLVFHADYGPDIKGANCYVDGELGIYPATDAQRYVFKPVKRSRTFPPPASKIHRRDSKRFEWRACNHRWRRVSDPSGLRLWADDFRRETELRAWGSNYWKRVRASVEALKAQVFEPRRSIECFDCGLVYARRRTEERERREWTIDLRNAKATIFCHPPSAWTHPGALSLDGFHYERSSGLGPLPPITSDNLLPEVHSPGPVKVVRNVVDMLRLLTILLGAALAAAAFATRAPHLAFVLPLLVTGLALMPRRQLLAPPLVRGLAPLEVRVRAFAAARGSRTARWARARTAARIYGAWLQRQGHRGTMVFPKGVAIEDNVSLFRQSAACVFLLLGAAAFWLLPEPLGRWRIMAPTLGAMILALAPLRYILARGNNPWGPETLPQDRRDWRRKAQVAVPAVLELAALFHAVNADEALLWMDNGFRIVVATTVAYLVTALLVNWFMAPQPLQFRSMGLEYLGRQRTDANRFQFLTSRYTPNETYRQAAQALREAGRYLSANEIERIRLFNREKLLSWRRHGASKLFLKVANLMSGFGFKLDRLALTIGCIVVLVAFCCHWTAYNGWLVPDPKEPKWTMSIDGQIGSANARLNGDYNDIDPATKATVPADPLLSCGERAAIAPDNSDVKACPGLVYAIDLLMPIDLNQDAWKVSDAALSRITKPFKPSATEPVQEAHPLLQGAARNAIAMVQLLGAVLAAFFLAALAIRAEAAFSRVEE